MEQKPAINHRDAKGKIILHSCWYYIVCIFVFSPGRIGGEEE